MKAVNCIHATRRANYSDCAAGVQRRPSFGTCERCPVRVAVCQAPALIPCCPRCYSIDHAIAECPEPAPEHGEPGACCH